MSNRNFVCFDCRTSVRREAYLYKNVPCSRCGKDTVALSYKIPLPAKNKDKEWNALAEQLMLAKNKQAENMRHYLTRRKHHLEKEALLLEEYLTKKHIHPYTAKKYRKQLRHVNNEIESIARKSQ